MIDVLAPDVTVHQGARCSRGGAERGIRTTDDSASHRINNDKPITRRLHEIANDYVTVLWNHSVESFAREGCTRKSPIIDDVWSKACHRVRRATTARGRNGCCTFARVQRFRSAFVAISSFVAAFAAVRLAQELSEYRRSLAAVRSEWAHIRAVGSSGVLRIHVRVAGNASAPLPSAVLVHGFGIGTSYLVPLASRLAPHMCVYAPDLPGHGASDHDARPLSVCELAAALTDWIDGQRLRSVLIIAHSFGCQIAAEVAAKRPDIVGGLLLVGPTCDVSGRTGAQQLVRALPSILFERPSLAICAAIDYTRAGPQVLWREFNDMLTHRIEDVLPQLQLPAQVVRGGRDWIAPHAWAEFVTRLLAAPAAVTVPGWGHAVHYDAPDIVAPVALTLWCRLRDVRDPHERCMVRLDHSDSA